MAKKVESKKKNEGCKIASFVAKYSNASTGAGYKSAIEAFLRCIYNKPKLDHNKHRIAYDYETLFENYLGEFERDREQDFTQFANCLKDECTSNQSARQIMTYARKMLEVHGVSIPKHAICDMKREMKGGSGTIDKAITPAILCSILKTADIRTRAAVLVMASSGLRINELLSLNISDVDLESIPVKVTVRAKNAKNAHQRYSFLTPEAVKALKEWLFIREEYLQTSAKKVQGLIKAKTVKGMTPIGDKVFPFSDHAIVSAWDSLLKESNHYSKDDVTGRNQMRVHSLRKFFVTQVTMAGAEKLAQFLSGHLGYLDANYLRFTPEYAGAEYLKLQSCLVVCLPEDVRQTVKIQDEKIQRYAEQIVDTKESQQYLRQKNEELQQRINDMEDKLNTILEYISNSASQPPTDAPAKPLYKSKIE